MIMRRTAMMRSPVPKNMCSVRHEADALGAVIARSLGVLGGVRVGENLEAAEFVDPGHELVQVAGYAGGASSTWPRMTSPVVPLRDNQSPS